MATHKHTSDQDCPVCGAALLDDTPYCYKCGSLLTDDRSHPMPLESVRDEDLIKLLQKSDKDISAQEDTTRYKISHYLTLLSFAGLIFSCIGVFIDALESISYFTAVAVLVVYGLARLIAPPKVGHMLDEDDITNLTRNYIVPKEVAAVFGDQVNYQPKEGMPESIVRANKFYYTGFDGYESSERIQGSYHGYPVDMARVKLTVSHTENGNKKVSDLFVGHCLFAHTDCTIPVQLRLVEKYFGFVGQLNEEDHPEDLDRIYQIHCSDPVVEQAILTDALRIKLVRLSKKCGVLNLVLNPDGTILIAVADSQEALTAETIPTVHKDVRENLLRPLQALDLLTSELSS